MPDLCLFLPVLGKLNLYAIQNSKVITSFSLTAPQILIFVEALQQKGKCSALVDREDSNLVLRGRKFCISSALTFKIANYNTIIGCYQLFWGGIFHHTLMQTLRRKGLAKVLQMGAIRLSKQQTKGAADCTARNLLITFSLRSHICLHSALLANET